MADKDDEGPGDGGTGMDKLDMKKLLARAKREPVNCALAQSDAKTGNLGLILFDKVKPPKELVRALKEQFPTMRTPCFGTATVDADDDPKQVTFKVNKRIPGLDRRLRKSLKGTGITKVEIEAGPGGGGDEDA